MSKTIPSKELRWVKLQADPTCRVCGLTKTVEDFPRNTVDYSCNDCRRKDAIMRYRKQRAEASPEQLKELKAKVNRRQNANRRTKLAAMTTEELAAHNAVVNAAQKATRDRVRDAVYRGYGGYECRCCGEKEPKFLSVDHVENDGAKHRRENKLQTGEQLYRWLLRKGLPSGFQILCMNCQWGKRNNAGVCPHQNRV